ncbi:MAG TPA: hypothetical protein ACFYEK_17930 [Candidatus Wunengus sp. YC60]|uniref:hypothetical protein n=1 Tax=Candidatus Wunengus sp. YC60 TaxID=3367697 RepID=UPI0040271D2E
MDEKELEATRKMGSDLCKHCDCRGKIVDCKEADCSLHESWYVTEIFEQWKRSANQCEELIFMLKNTPLDPSPTISDVVGAFSGGGPVRCSDCYLFMERRG